LNDATKSTVTNPINSSAFKVQLESKMFDKNEHVIDKWDMTLLLLLLYYVLSPFLKIGKMIDIYQSSSFNSLFQKELIV
jgi:hypothetical protein